MAKYSTYEQPTPEQVRELLVEIADLAKGRLPQGWGFVFLAATHGEGGQCAYISDLKRDNVCEMMLEFVAKHSDA